MASMTSLPTELLLMVGNYLEQRDLYQLCLVSIHFRQTFQDPLYQNISTTFDPDTLLCIRRAFNKKLDVKLKVKFKTLKDVDLRGRHWPQDVLLRVAGKLHDNMLLRLPNISALGLIVSEQASYMDRLMETGYPIISARPQQGLSSIESLTLRVKPEVGRNLGIIIVDYIMNNKIETSNRKKLTVISEKAYHPLREWYSDVPHDIVTLRPVFLTALPLKSLILDFDVALLSGLLNSCYSLEHLGVRDQVFWAEGTIEGLIRNKATLRSLLAPAFDISRYIAPHREVNAANIQGLKNITNLEILAIDSSKISVNSFTRWIPDGVRILILSHTDLLHEPEPGRPWRALAHLESLLGSISEFKTLHNIRVTRWAHGYDDESEERIERVRDQAASLQGFTQKFDDCGVNFRCQTFRRYSSKYASDPPDRHYVSLDVDGARKWVRDPHWETPSHVEGIGRRQWSYGQPRKQTS